MHHFLSSTFDLRNLNLMVCYSIVSCWSWIYIPSLWNFETSIFKFFDGFFKTQLLLSICKHIQDHMPCVVHFLCIIPIQQFPIALFFNYLLWFYKEHTWKNRPIELIFNLWNASKLYFNNKKTFRLLFRMHILTRIWNQ